MNYIGIFNNDYRVIISGTVALTIIFIGFVISIFAKKIPFTKKWYTRNRMTFIMFILGFIFGFIIAWINNFKIFDYDNNDFYWIRNLIYLSSSLVRLSFTIMFLGFLITLPFRLFSNFYMFTKYRNPIKKIAKVSMIYFGFGAIALLISCLQYFFKDSFFAFSSNFSYSSGILDKDSVPTIYYICDYTLSNLFKIRSTEFSIYFFISLICLIVIEIIFVKLMNYYAPKKIDKIAKKINKISKTTEIFTMITPSWAFSGIAVSLMVQTIATFLRIAVVLLLVLIFAIVVLLLNFIYTMSTRTIQFKLYLSLLKKSAKYIFTNPISDSSINNLSDSKTFRGFKDFNKEQDVYNIFMTTIFPLIITSYLGFSSGPLLNPNFPVKDHIFYFAFLYFFGYIFMFAYAFKFLDIVPFKVMLWSSTPYIRSGFNTTILLLFNNLINKVALYSTFATFISIACKHDRKYKKMII